MFDKKYFKDIWDKQGVHRHDYCETLVSVSPSVSPSASASASPYPASYVNKYSILGNTNMGMEIEDY